MLTSPSFSPLLPLLADEVVQYLTVCTLRLKALGTKRQERCSGGIRSKDSRKQPLLYIVSICTCSLDLFKLTLFPPPPIAQPSDRTRAVARGRTRGYDRISTLDSDVMSAETVRWCTPPGLRITIRCTFLLWPANAHNYKVITACGKRFMRRPVSITSQAP